MNEIEPQKPEFEIVVAKENKDSRAQSLTNRFVLRHKSMRSVKDDAESTESKVIIDDAILNLPENKKKIGSHRLSELHSFRSRFR